MRITTTEEQKTLAEFAERAAKKFGSDDTLATYTDKNVEGGELFAVRWGYGHWSVLVFRVCESMEPVVYSDLMKGEVMG